MPEPIRHPFLGQHYPPKARILILGSFPCPGKDGYGDWFYSGSGRNFFWPLLAEVFQSPAKNLEDKLSICEQNHLLISDIFAKVIRSQGNCSDQNLEIIQDNSEEIGAILKHFKPQRLLFTSQFVERYFLKHIANKISHLPPEMSSLPSPSPAANRAIGMMPEYKSLRQAGVLKDTYQYRLLKYREALK